LIGHTGSVSAMELAGGHVLYSAAADDSIRVWNLQTGQCSMTIKLKAPVGVRVVFFQIYSWRIALRENESHSNFMPLSLQLSRHDDSMFVQHASDPAVTQIHIKTNKVTRKFEGHAGKINVMKFSLHHMYTGSDDGTLRRWNLKRGTCSSVFKGHK